MDQVSTIKQKYKAIVMVRGKSPPSEHIQYIYRENQDEQLLLVFKNQRVA